MATRGSGGGTQAVDEASEVDVGRAVRGAPPQERVDHVAPGGNRPSRQEGGPAAALEEVIRGVAHHLPVDRSPHEAQTVLRFWVDDLCCTIERRQPPDGPDRTLSLSPREREIAAMVAKGYTNKTMAHVLDISTWTVATHLRHIFSKLGVNTRASMVAVLLEQSGSPNYPHVPLNGSTRTHVED